MPLTFPSLEFLFTPLRSRRRASLDCLHNDILVDNVFDYLDVQDIIRLRQTSRIYYHLTHEAIVWKRLLQRTTLPLPSLPPTTRRTLAELTAEEAERLMVRAYCTDKFWKFAPHMREYWTFDSYWQVEEMKPLPGSQYLVASAANSDRTEWALVLYMLDKKANAMPIARMPTKSKAYNLHARYMTLDGVPGIAVTFIRRAYIYSRQRRNAPDINGFSGDYDIDFAGPVKHECQVVHISLPAIEALTTCGFAPGSPEFLEFSKSQPAPFRCAYKARTDSSRLAYPSLQIVNGQPTVTIIRFPDTLWVFPIESTGNRQIKMQLLPHDQWIHNRHRLKAVRVLPNQQQVLVIREIDVHRNPDEHAVIAMELHDLPHIIPGPSLDHKSTAREVHCISDRPYREIYISEPAIRNWLTDDTQPGIPERDDDLVKPEPLHILLCAYCYESGLSRLTLYPHRVQNWRPPSPESDSSSDNDESESHKNKKQKRPAQPASFWKYDFSPGNLSQLRFLKCFDDRKYRVILGSFRTILYTIPWRDLSDKPVVIDFWRWFERDMLDYQEDDTIPEGEPVPRVMQEIRTELEPAKISAFAWDDTIGRLFIAKPDQLQLTALDFAHRPKQDFLRRNLTHSDADIDDEPMSVDDHDDYVCELMLVGDIMEHAAGERNVMPQSPRPTKFYHGPIDEDDDWWDQETTDNEDEQQLRIRNLPSRRF